MTRGHMMLSWPIHLLSRIHRPIPRESCQVKHQLSPSCIESAAGGFKYFSCSPLLGLCFHQLVCHNLSHHSKSWKKSQDSLPKLTKIIKDRRYPQGIASGAGAMFGNGGDTGSTERSTAWMRKCWTNKLWHTILNTDVYMVSVSCQVS